MEKSAEKCQATFTAALPHSLISANKIVERSLKQPFLSYNKNSFKTKIPSSTYPQLLRCLQLTAQASRLITKNPMTTRKKNTIRFAEMKGQQEEWCKQLHSKSMTTVIQCRAFTDHALLINQSWGLLAGQLPCARLKQQSRLSYSKYSLIKHLLEM